MAIPAALKLQAAGLLSAIVIPAKHQARLLPSFIQSGFENRIIHMVQKETLGSELESLLQQYQADTVMVITFPWKLPENVLSIPSNGCFNFHPGLLPKYKGADPIFWQIRNRESKAGITVHLMTSKIDDGPVLMVEELPMIPGETYGIHVQRIALLINDSIMKCVAAIQDGKRLDEQDALAASLFTKKPVREQLIIDWNKHSAAEIEALINASNPKYNGACTSIRNIEASILEVSPADLNNGPEDLRPGTIVYADALYGLVVACMDKQFLKINIMCMQEGYLSGSKLFSMGFARGEIFGN